LANSGYGRSAIPRPGPVGGPCLSKDTYLLGQDNDQILDLLFRARKANEKYEEYLTNSIVDIVKSKKKDKVIVAGVAFKGEPKTNDDRNSFGKSLLIRLDQLKISKVLKYWDPLVDIGLCPRIESMDMFKDELANAILIITNNNEEISSFLNSLPRDYWTEIDNLLIIDIGGRVSLAKDSCELIHLGNLKQ
jgi:UDP-N-acetyl-D-mannosaminuronate dehydrogenase